MRRVLRAKPRSQLRARWRPETVRPPRGGTPSRSRRAVWRVHRDVVRHTRGHGGATPGCGRRGGSPGRARRAARRAPRQCCPGRPHGHGGAPGYRGASGSSPSCARLRSVAGPAGGPRGGRSPAPVGALSPAARRASRLLPPSLSSRAALPFILERPTRTQTRRLSPPGHARGRKGREGKLTPCAQMFNASPKRAGPGPNQAGHPQETRRVG